MGDTYLTTNPGDIQRWAAEYDLVPVREHGGHSFVETAEAAPDQEQLHWDEFHAERPESSIVVHRRHDDSGTLAIGDQETVLDRLALDESHRGAIRDRLANGETVTISDDAIDADRPVAALVDDTDVTTAEGTDHPTEPTDRDVGKVVVTPTGDEVGVAVAVDDDEIYVDPHPGLTERALATLGWSDADESDVSLAVDRVDHVTVDAIRLSDDVDDAFHESTAGR